MEKGGVSQVVTYVLLIVVAIGLSVMVFAFLQNIIPKEKFECPEGLSLIIRDVECVTLGVIKIDVANKGRFDIDGIYARYSNSIDQAASYDLLPDENYGSINIITQGQKNKGLGFMYFGRSNPIPLYPGADYTQHFDYGINGPINLKKIELQPFLNLEGERTLGICETKVVTREISCP